MNMNQVRKPKPEKDSLKGRVVIRCSEKEIEWLTKESKKYGLTRAGYAFRMTFHRSLSNIPRLKEIEL